MAAALNCVSRGGDSRTRDGHNIGRNAPRIEMATSAAMMTSERALRVMAALSA
jgi:hypothetical protein